MIPDQLVPRIYNRLAWMEDQPQGYNWAPKSAWHEQAGRCGPPDHHHTCHGCGLQLGARDGAGLGLMIAAHQAASLTCRWVARVSFVKVPV